MGYKEHYDVTYIFRATITVNGVTLRAKDYGKKAFKIPVTRPSTK